MKSNFQDVSHLSACCLRVSRTRIAATDTITAAFFFFFVSVKRHFVCSLYVLFKFFSADCVVFLSVFLRCGIFNCQALEGKLNYGREKKGWIAGEVSTIPIRSSIHYPSSIRGFPWSVFVNNFTLPTQVKDTLLCLAGTTQDMSLFNLTCQNSRGWLVSFMPGRSSRRSWAPISTLRWLRRPQQKSNYRSSRWRASALTNLPAGRLILPIAIKRWVPWEGLCSYNNQDRRARSAQDSVLIVSWYFRKRARPGKSGVVFRVTEFSQKLAVWSHIWSLSTLMYSFPSSYIPTPLWSEDR